MAFNNSFGTTCIGSHVDKPQVVKSLIPVAKLAIEEDWGNAQLAERLIAEGTAQGLLITRQDCIYCGDVWVKALQTQCEFDVLNEVADGKFCRSGDTLLVLKASYADLLCIERTLINGIQTLSATSTETRKMTRLIEHYECQILDTRKTLPAMRLAQKYAVYVGGGVNHRLGLYDAVMIKENHQNSQIPLSQQFDLIKRHLPERPIIIEVENTEQAAIALSLNPQQVLLDNFSVDQIIQTVNLKPPNCKTKLEASGGIHESNLCQYAASGVDYISLGSITKSIEACDLSMSIQPLS